MEKVSARDLKQQLQQHHLKQATRELKSHEEMKSLFKARGFCKRQTDARDDSRKYVCVCRLTNIYYWNCLLRKLSKVNVLRDNCCWGARSQAREASKSGENFMVFWQAEVCSLAFPVPLNNYLLSYSASGRRRPLVWDHSTSRLWNKPSISSLSSIPSVILIGWHAQVNSPICWLIKVTWKGNDHSFPNCCCWK